jgi:hypothetical protein
MTSDGRLVGIVRSRIQTMEFCLFTFEESLKALGLFKHVRFQTMCISIKTMRSGYLAPHRTTYFSSFTAFCVSYQPSVEN